MRIIFLFITVALFVFDALAYGNCHPPQAPSCIYDSDTYEDDDYFTSCKDQVQTYSDKISSYIECSKSAIQKTIDDTQAKVDKESKNAVKLIEKFNCKAEHKEGC